jgi:hypothetical protein
MNTPKPKHTVKATPQRKEQSPSPQVNPYAMSAQAAAAALRRAGILTPTGKLSRIYK